MGSSPLLYLGINGNMSFPTLFLLLMLFHSNYQQDAYTETSVNNRGQSINLHWIKVVDFTQNGLRIGEVRLWGKDLTEESSWFQGDGHILSAGLGFIFV